jgi:hypothetical protein
MSDFQYAVPDHPYIKLSKKRTGVVPVNDGKPIESPMLRLFAAVKAVLEADRLSVWNESTGEVHSCDGSDYVRAESFEVFLDRKQFDELEAAYRALNLEDEEKR